MRRAFTHAAITLSLSLAASCSAPLDDAPDVAQAVAAITQVPADVRCIDVTVAGANTVTQRFTVTPGASATLTMPGLPIGAVTFVAVAYNLACASVVSTTPSTWVSTGVRAVLATGVSTSVTLPLRRAAAASVSVDFNGDAGTPCGPASAIDCDGDLVNGCEVNRYTDYNNCGACGVTCGPTAAATGVTYACVTGTCRPSNDTCAAATPINLAASPEVWLNAATTGATQDLTPPCRATAAPDVFFSFTLTQREAVYADTFGDALHAAPTWDTVLFLASSCTTPLTSPPAREVYCSDDAATQGCSADGTRSQVFAVLNPGTYYLVLSGASGATGRAPIRVQHLPVGNGVVTRAVVTPGSAQTLTGTTSGTGTLTACSGGAGPENAYWWPTCSDSPSGYTLVASTCSSATVFDTVVTYRSATTGSTICNDDAGASVCAAAATASLISTPMPGGAGLHTLVIDGYAAATAGAYTLMLNLTRTIM